MVKEKAAEKARVARISVTLFHFYFGSSTEWWKKQQSDSFLSANGLQVNGICGQNGRTLAGATSSQFCLWQNQRADLSLTAVLSEPS